MLKIIGIALIALSIVAFGYLHYINLKKRPQELMFFLKLFYEYETNLKWYQNSLKELMKDFAFEEFKEYVEATKKLLYEKNYIDSFINENEYFTKFHLISDDKKVLEYFFTHTGCYGLDTEIELCEKTLAELETLKAESEAKYKKMGPFYVKISIVLGIWIIILLF